MEGSPYADMSKTATNAAPGAIAQESGRSAVSVAAERLDNAIDHLDRVTAMLDERLGAILRPLGPQNPTEGVPDDVTGVPLADAIAARAARVQHYALVLGGLHDRIEL